jgi:hypothetical protein
VTRHRRLQRTLRSPQRQARTWRNRANRIFRRELAGALAAADRGENVDLSRFGFIPEDPS